MIILSSNYHLKLLQRASYWVMDGTFKSAPKIMCQIYAIHGEVGASGKWVPLVIALLENKSKNTYTNHQPIRGAQERGTPTEVAVVDVECGRTEGGHSPQKRRTQYEATDARIARIQGRYEDYKDNDDVLAYLRAIGNNVAGNI